MQKEEVTEIPLIYPMISVTLKTTTIVDGRPIVSECEEIIDLSSTKRTPLAVLIGEFRDYVEKIIATAQSPQARDALQNILDTHSRDQQQRSTDLPSSPGSQGDPAQGTLPLEPPAASPDKASL